MKTTIRTILCAAAVVMAAASCQKSAEPVQPAEEGKETIDICVNGLMGEYTQVDQSKAQLVNNVRVSWEGDETVYVFDGVKCLGSLAASLEGDEDRYAVLSTDGSTHKVSTPAPGTTTLTLVYSPLLTEAPAVSNDAISISLARQSGEKAPFVAYATMEYTGTSISNVVVPFKFATSVIKVNCTGLKPGTAITSATLSNVNTECKLTLSGTAAPSVSGDINGTITRTGDAYFAADKVNEEGEAVFQIAVPALEAASEARVLAVKQGSSRVGDKNFSMKKIAAATSVNTVCQLSSIPIPDGALPGLFTVDSNGKQVFFSKGNLYYNGTTFNFEANQYDTTPLSNSARVENHISHFMWCANATNAMTLKYDNGWNEDKTFFAGKNFTVNGYSGWSMLTGDIIRGEWSYLLNIRDGNRFAKARVHGINGLIIFPDGYTLPSGYSSDGGGIGMAKVNDTFAGFPLDDKYNPEDIPNETWSEMEATGVVFLPAAGYRDGNNGNADVSNVGGNGYYWSASPIGDSLAFDLSFSSFNVNPSDYDQRNRAQSVRLVTECQ